MPPPRPPLVVGVAVVLAALLAGCERKPEPEPAVDRLVLTPVAFDALPGWSEDPVAEALPALRRSCEHLLWRPEDTRVGPNGLGGTVGDWHDACAAIAALPPADDQALRGILEQGFVPFRVANQERASGLFTGYYEAEVRADLSAGSQYRWPIYRRPVDLVTVDLGQFRSDLAGVQLVGRVDDGRLLPYPSRSEIDAGTLAGRGLELLWLDDPVDAFFLHVQGSGRAILPDGSVQRVGYAASNGRAFTAIGRLLIEEGRIERRDVSMQSIRDWLRDHPVEAAAVMQRNERYIFFRPIDGDGPIGAQGVVLTAGRSLAVDPAFLPLGAPLWLDTTWPGSERPLRRLMVAQDSGSAIKGPVRGDVYWGSGDAALAVAGRMKQEGGYFLLLPRAVAARRQEPIS